MSAIKYSTYNLLANNDKDIFFVTVDSSFLNKSELLQELSHQLRFPDYFGKNWDALYDCMTDLSWISERQIIVVLSNFSCLKEDEKKTFWNIVNDVVKYWNNNNDNCHDIVFFFLLVHTHKSIFLFYNKMMRKKLYFYIYSMIYDTPHT
jgi:RNAse (barnase) inhibitor barstar